MLNQARDQTLLSLPETVLGAASEITKFCSFQSLTIWKHYVDICESRGETKLKHSRFFLRELKAQTREQWAWIKRIYAGPNLARRSTPTCAVVVLSWRRPANIALIIKAALRCESVTSIVLSNNNPEIDIQDFLKCSDPRLQVISQPVPTRQGIRLQLAASVREDICILLDDDVFLFPEQIEQLVHKVAAAPDRPHGLLGERKNPKRKGYPFDSGVQGDLVEVDHLTQVYAGAKPLFVRAVAVMREFKLVPEKFGNGEDIIFSFSGRKKPLLHDLGPVLQCASSEVQGIATWKTYQNFGKERLALHRSLVKKGRGRIKKARRRVS